MIRMKNSLSEYLQQNNETQMNLAQRAGVSQSTISRAVNGDRIDTENALKIEKATGIDKLDLLYPNAKQAA